MKTKRQRKIIELINKQNIETQEELARLLIESGFQVTQATISRDIRELNLTKVSTEDKKQKYVLGNVSNITINSKYMRVLNDGILSLDTAGNILVIKTVAGMAMAVGAAIDAIEIKEIIGCIAGDDTVMCVIKNSNKIEEVKNMLEDFII